MQGQVKPVPTVIQTYVASRDKSGNIKPLSRAEKLCMLYTVMAQRSRGGTSILYTTEQSFHQVQSLSALYTRIFFLPEEVVGVNRDVFWAVHKVLAYGMTKPPFISVDLDAVLVTSPSASAVHLHANASPLHSEPVSWEGYKSAQDLFGEYVPFLTQSDWNHALPYNMGVCYFTGADEGEFLASYTTTAMRFMTQFSASLKNTDALPVIMDPCRAQGSNFYREMIFAEQYLLGLVAHNTDAELAPLTHFVEDPQNSDMDHAAPNPWATHLWNSKRHYAKKPEELAHFERSMADALVNTFGKDVLVHLDDPNFYRMAYDYNVPHPEIHGTFPVSRYWRPSSPSHRLL